MRKTHNKLFYGKYTHKNTFYFGCVLPLHPTTSEHMKSIVSDPEYFTKRHVYHRNSRDEFGYQSLGTLMTADQQQLMRKLALFILTNKSELRFRIQDSRCTFYSNKDYADRLLAEFGKHHESSIEVHPDALQNTANKVICKRLPHKQYRYQVYVKDVSISNIDQIRESLKVFIENNNHVCRIGSSGVQRWLDRDQEVKQGYFYYYPNTNVGYFYVQDEKALSMIYLIAQPVIGKVVEYIVEQDNK